jgi:putative ABC transport system permease protein
VQRHQSIEELEIGVSWEGLRRVQRIFWWAELFIHIAIGATLLMGGVGIWNVMAAAVRSRTREIGLKKAFGADDGDIFKQFLAEALGLSLGSSFLGIVLGWITVACIFYTIGTHPPEYLFLYCAALGLVFGVFLGIGAGLLPSIQASHMQVVDAMSYE